MGPSNDQNDNHLSDKAPHLYIMFENVHMMTFELGMNQSISYFSSSHILVDDGPKDMDFR